MELWRKIGVALSLSMAAGGAATLTQRPAESSIYYISSSSGNDQNSGTSPAEAWQHLHMIFLKSSSSTPFRPGDEILLKRGDQWYEQIRLRGIGTAELPLRIGAYGEGQKPLLYGDEPEMRWEPVPGYPNIYTSDMGPGSVVGAVYLGRKSLPAVYPEGSLKSEAAMRAFLGKLRSGSSVGQSDGRLWLRMEDGQSPVGRVRCFRAAGISLSDSAYVRVENLDVRHFSTGIDIENSNHVMVQHNDIQDVLGIGIYLRSGDSDCRVESNTVFRAGNTALYVLKGAHNTFRDNWVSHVDSTILGIPVRGDQMGIGLQESKQTLVEDNYFSQSGGIDFYYEQNSTVRGNYLERVRSAGAPHGTDLTVIDNIYNLTGADGEPASKGINAVATGPGSIAVLNNSIFNATGFFLKGSASGGGEVEFRGNIAAATTSGAILGEFSEAVSSDHNCYSAPGDGPFRYRTQTFTSLALYQAETGLETGSVLAKPSLVDRRPESPLDFRNNSFSGCGLFESHPTVQAAKPAQVVTQTQTCRFHCLHHAFTVADGVYRVRVSFKENEVRHLSPFHLFLNGRIVEVQFAASDFSAPSGNLTGVFLVRPQSGTITLEAQSPAAASAIARVDILGFDDSHGEGLQIIPW